MKIKFYKFLCLFVSFYLFSCGDNSSSESNPVLPILSSSSSSSEIALSSSEVFSSSSEIALSSSMEVSSSSEIALSSSEVFSSSSEIALSSSEVFSSSSKIESSSSEKIPSKIYDCSKYECITTAYLNPEIEYGEYLDTRDNQVYRTVQIGEQVWMAQNLNYAANDSYCYKDSLTRCATVGRLYSWETALNVCPDGWHLPDTTEFNYLVDYITEQKESYSVISILSSKSNRSALYGSAYDFFGYSVVHGSGYKRGIWDYDEGGLFLGNTYFWTASESIQEKYPAETYARVRYFNVGTYETLAKLTWPKNYALAVRCIKD